MQHACVAFPILPGQSDNARAFMRQLDTTRRAEYDRSERRIGITKEVWFLAPLPSGHHLVGYMESADFQAALQQFAASRDGFDVWFKSRFLDVTGFDFQNPPAEMTFPELLSLYQPAPVTL